MKEIKEKGKSLAHQQRRILTGSEARKTNCRLLMARHVEWYKKDRGYHTPRSNCMMKDVSKKPKGGGDEECRLG